MTEEQNTMNPTPPEPLETFKAFLQKRLASNPTAAFGPKIDVSALFPPQSTKAPKKRRAPKKAHRSLASLYWDAIDEQNAKVFVDAMEASIKNKTYDEGFKIVVNNCEELRKLLYEKEYGLYDEELAESHPDSRIENTVFTFQNFFLEMAERDCPDDGEEDEETAAAILRICEEETGRSSKYENW